MRQPRPGPKVGSYPSQDRRPRFHGHAVARLRIVRHLLHSKERRSHQVHRSNIFPTGSLSSCDDRGNGFPKLWTTLSSCLAARCAPTAVRASTTSLASRSQVEVRKEFNPPLLANPMYRHAIAAALLLLPCSCEEGSLRMTKLFHACTVQLGIVSLFYRCRLTSLIKVDGAAADRFARRRQLATCHAMHAINHHRDRLPPAASPRPDSMREPPDPKTWCKIDDFHVRQHFSLRGRHCEERERRSNPFFLSAVGWIASRSLSSGAHSGDPLARNDSELERPQEIQKILLLVRLKPIEKSPHHHIGLGPAAPVFLDGPLQIRGPAVMKEEDTLP